MLSSTIRTRQVQLSVGSSSIYRLCRTSFSTKKSRGSKYAQKFNIKPTADAELPQFANLLRQFYRQSHPDLLRASNGEYANINDQSWQVFNGILTTIKEKNSYPPQMVKDIPFYVRSNNIDSDYVCRILRVRTGGGDCKKQLTLTLQNFFVESGLSTDGKFSWDKEYFPMDAI